MSDVLAVARSGDGSGQRGPRWPLRPELAAPLGVWPLSQLACCVAGRASKRLSGGVAVHACFTLYCARLTTRRLPCRCRSRRIRPTSGRRHRGHTPSTAGPKLCRAHVAATAPVHTLTPVPARPAAAGGGVVSAAATPGSMRPTPLDWPCPRYSGRGPVSCCLEGQRQNSLTVGYVSLVGCGSRVKRADLPAFCPFRVIR